MKKQLNATLGLLFLTSMLAAVTSAQGFKAKKCNFTLDIASPPASTSVGKLDDIIWTENALWDLSKGTFEIGCEGRDDQTFYNNDPRKRMMYVTSVVNGWKKKDSELSFGSRSAFSIGEVNGGKYVGTSTHGIEHARFIYHRNRFIWIRITAKNEADAAELEKIADTLKVIVPGETP